VGDYESRWALGRTSRWMLEQVDELHLLKDYLQAARHQQLEGRR